MDKTQTNQPKYHADSVEALASINDGGSNKTLSDQVNRQRIL